MHLSTSIPAASGDCCPMREYIWSSQRTEKDPIMTIQTLVVTMNQADYSLPEHMNLQTDAIVGNQCDRNEITAFEYHGHEVQYVSSAMRGVGINRNEILMRASADICVLADDDMTFLDGYEDTVQHWFEKLPDADMLIFNLEGGKKRYINTVPHRVRWLDYGKYGAARLAFRTGKVRFSGVMFHTMFGGGCQYSCGEDTLFLRDCLRKGLKIYGVPAAIARIEDETSTWFQGYTDQYFFDKGVLYYALSGRLCRLRAWFHGLRYRKEYREYGWKNAVKQMLKGIESVR